MSLILHRPSREKMPWPLAVAAALCLSGVAAVGAKPTPAPTAQKAAPAAVSGPQAPAEDEDNDLLEHWDDPRYAREERFQIAGMVGLFAAAGVYGVIRRSRIRRAYVRP